jgi:putative toxin-antitoxin system antitoxin component (TIGR02293 family)
MRQVAASPLVVAILSFESYPLSQGGEEMARLRTAKKLVGGKVTAHSLMRPVVFRQFVAKEAPIAAKIDVIRSGINASIVADMVQYFHVPKSDIFDILLTPASTAHRLIKEKRLLDPAASERVVRVADIARIAEETFGGRAAATQWLKAPNLALDNVTPLSMLATEPGAAEVRRLLASINYGGIF